MGVVNIAAMALGVFPIAFFCYRERGDLNFILRICRRFRVSMLFEVLLVCAATVALTVTIITYLPFLGWGWWSVFSHDGVAGNVLIAPLNQNLESPHRIVVAFIFLYFLAIFVMLPLLAKVDEDMFRKGHNDWRSIGIYSVLFGLGHLAAGIPIAVGFVLILPGFFFGYKYKRSLTANRLTFSNHDFSSHHLVRQAAAETSINDYERWAVYEAVLVSTTYHTLYNAVFFSLMFAAVIVSVART